MESSTRPRELEAALRAAGGRLAETVSVLAFDMTEGLPRSGDVGDVTARLVATPGDAREYGLVNAAVWKTPPPDDEATARVLREAEDGTGLRVVAMVDGQAASCGGLTLADDVARLWGAGTLPEARHGGAYRAVLRERLRVARERGATLALVKGRVETSAPILTRMGFTSHGAERAYVIPVRP